MSNEITKAVTGLIIPEDVSEEQFFDYGSKLAQAGKTLQWYIGDWYNAIRWGDKKAACEKAGLNYKTAKDFGSICQRFEMSARNDILTFNHHKVVAALPEEERTNLLQQAGEEKLSVAKMKKLIAPKEDEVGYNFEREAIEAGLVKAGSGGPVAKLKMKVDLIDPEAQKLKDVYRLRAAFKQIQDDVTPIEATRDEIKTLPEPAQKKLARLEATLMRQLEADFMRRVWEKAREMIPEVVAHYEEAEQKATVEFRNYALRKQGIKPHLTEADYRFLRQTVAPDRYPEEYRDRLTKAAQIINQFDKYVEAFKHA